MTPEIEASYLVGKNHSVSWPEVAQLVRVRHLRLEADRAVNRLSQFCECRSLYRHIRRHPMGFYLLICDKQPVDTWIGRARSEKQVRIPRERTEIRQNQQDRAAAGGRGVGSHVWPLTTNAAFDQRRASRKRHVLTATATRPPATPSAHQGSQPPRDWLQSRERHETQSGLQGQRAGRTSESPPAHRRTRGLHR